MRPLSSSTMVIQWDEPELPNGQVTVSKFELPPISIRPHDNYAPINLLTVFHFLSGLQSVLHHEPVASDAIVGLANGIIISARFRVSENCMGIAWTFLFPQVDNNQLTTISELTPHTVYTIRVQAFTSVGPGPLSGPVQVKTQQGQYIF